MATIFQTACTASGDWDGTVADPGCSVTFDTPTAGRMRATAVDSTNDMAFARKLTASAISAFTYAIKGLKVVQFGGAGGATAIPIALIQDAFNTEWELQIDSSGRLFPRVISGGFLNANTINGTSSAALVAGTEYNVLCRGAANGQVQHYLNGVSWYTTPAMSGATAMASTTRVAAGITSAPSAWSGSPLILEFDDITVTDSALDDPYGDLTPAAKAPIHPVMPPRFPF